LLDLYESGLDAAPHVGIDEADCDPELARQAALGNVAALDCIEQTEEDRLIR
jgi:hypothetical protein